MPSKGISVYSYTSTTDVAIEFTVPKERIVNTSADNFSRKDLEVESENIPGAANFTGQFQWRVLRDGVVIASAYNNINSLSGRMEGGTMTKTEAALSIVKDDLIISYGFYDSGVGIAGLPNKEQCWVTVTPNHQNLMGEVAPVGSPEAAKPFSRFALAAPHDCGMNSMQSSDTVLQNVDADVVKDLTPHIQQLKWFDDIVRKCRTFFTKIQPANINSIPSNILIHFLPDIIYGLAITQKDTIPTMLALGARYFEFRPADLLPIFQDVSPAQNKPYFEHACIPGLAFEEFLEQQVLFLDAHPAEMVTIHIRWDNIVSECRKPTIDEIGDYLDAACRKATNSILTWGGSECFSRTIDSLREAGKRLVVLIEAEKYDSWTATAYATLNAKPILAQFESMTTKGQQSTDLTVLQCQATSQSIKEVLVYSVMASNASTSCLTATKGALDCETLPWIRDNVMERLQAERLMVIMNDFIDGATTDTAVELSRKRLAL